MLRTDAGLELWRLSPSPQHLKTTPWIGGGNKLVSGDNLIAVDNGRDLFRLYETACED